MAGRLGRFGVFRGCVGRLEVVRGKRKKNRALSCILFIPRPLPAYGLSVGKKIKKSGERSEPYHAMARKRLLGF